MFRCLIQCGASSKSLDRISLRHNGLSSKDVFELAMLLIPPINDTDRSNHGHNHDHESCCDGEHEQQEQQEQQVQQLVSPPPRTDVSLMWIDLSWNDIVEAADLIRSWLKWGDLSAVTVPSVLLPVLDLSGNEISDEEAGQIASLLLEYEDKEEQQKSSADASFLGCLLLHDNEINEEGLRALETLSSRWCITVDDTRGNVGIVKNDDEEEGDKKKGGEEDDKDDDEDDDEEDDEEDENDRIKDVELAAFHSATLARCGCGVTVQKKTSTLSIDQLKQEPSTNTPNCLYTQHAREITFGEFQGKDDWSNNLYSMIFAEDSSKDRKYAEPSEDL